MLPPAEKERIGQEAMSILLNRLNFPFRDVIDSPFQVVACQYWGHAVTRSFLEDRLAVYSKTVLPDIPKKPGSSQHPSRNGSM